MAALLHKCNGMPTTVMQNSTAKQVAGALMWAVSKGGPAHGGAALLAFNRKHSQRRLSGCSVPRVCRGRRCCRRLASYGGLHAMFTAERHGFIAAYAAVRPDVSTGALHEFRFVNNRRSKVTAALKAKPGIVTMRLDPERPHKRGFRACTHRTPERRKSMLKVGLQRQAVL